MELKLNSSNDPSVLLGYQIILPFNMNDEENFIAGNTTINDEHIYIIIDSGKNNLRRTEFKVVNLSSLSASKTAPTLSSSSSSSITAPLWVRLKRGDKPGIEFRIMRHVVAIYVNSY